MTEVRSVCGLCRRQQVEPRVLPCLHSFCTGCLMELELSQAGHDSDQWSNEGSGDAGRCGEPCSDSFAYLNVQPFEFDSSA